MLLIIGSFLWYSVMKIKGTDFWEKQEAEDKCWHATHFSVIRQDSAMN